MLITCWSPMTETDRSSANLLGTSLFSLGLLPSPEMQLCTLQQCTAMVLKGKDPAESFWCKILNIRWQLISYSELGFLRHLLLK